MLSVHCYCCLLRGWICCWGWSCGWDCGCGCGWGCGWSCGWCWCCTVLRSSEREVRDLHAAIATRGKRNGDREGGLLELHLRAPHGPLHHSLAPCLCLLLSLPAPELPLPLQPFSWGLRLQELGQGGHTGALGAHFNFHPQNHYKWFNYHFEFSSQRPPRINEKFRFLAKRLINFRIDHEQTA